MTVPFGGFQRETLEFLRGLGANNTYAWFDAHRADYERDYLSPALAFIEAMREPLRSLHPDVHADARVNGSLFRINRDVRFSRNKTPYCPRSDSRPIPASLASPEFVEYCLSRLRPLTPLLAWVANL